MGSTFARNKKGRKHPKSGYAQAESKQSNRDGYYFVRQQFHFLQGLTGSFLRLRANH